MRIDNLLNEEIRQELEELSKMEVGTDSHRSAVDGVTKLMDRAIELEKIDVQHELESDKQEFERRVKHMQMAEDRKDRLIKNIITIGGILVPAVITIWGTCATINFEKEGTITSTAGRKFFNRLFPSK